MSKTIPTNKPTAIILHGGNVLGIRLAETLATQRVHLILVDEFTRSTKDAIKTIRTKFGADAYDVSAIPTLTQNLKRVDYMILLLDHYLSNNESISSKKFLSETNIVDSLCKLALEQGAKVILTTSLDLHRRLSSFHHTQTETLRDVSTQKPYTTVELQRYCENLVAEYHDQSMLNVRIARTGELMGEDISLSHSSIFIQMLKESITKPRITIPGEGLYSTYYVHLLDVVYGIIKALFSNKTNGEVYTLSYPDEISTLNLAYKILEMNPTATEIAFGEDSDIATPSHTYVPAKNLTKLGWEPKIPFEQALHETMAYCFRTYKVTWKDKPEPISVTKTKLESAGKKLKNESSADRSERMTTFGSLLNSISQPFRQIRENYRTNVTSFKKTTFRKENLPRYAIYAGIILLLFAFVLGPLIQLVLGAGGSYYYAKKAYQQGLSLDTDRAETSLSRLRYSVSLTGDGWNGLRWISFFPGAKPFYTETATLISAADHASAAGYYLALGAEPYVDYIQNFEPLNSFNATAGGGSREYTEELELMQQRISYLETASIEVSLAQKLIADVDLSVYPSYISKRLRTLTDLTDKTETSLETLQQFAVQAPTLLGVDGRKTYIVLFQNPMELRSTGGWITSVGIVGIEHGQIRKLEVKDVYEIDGQITEKVPPPQSMQDELDVRDWTLSLANWSPDFPITAEAVEYFLSLSGDAVTADGVIAIDLEFVRDMIDVWGAINVPGESEAITKDNLYDKVVEIHREFTPGSTRKPLFLSNLANEILQKTLSANRSEWPDIAGKVGAGLEEKHILVFFNDPSINSVITSSGWGGQLDPLQNVLFPVEWNWGGNKANHFTSRITDISVNVSDETHVQQTVTVTYENKSTVNKYPEGDYVNFERIYIPRGAKVTRIEGLSRVAVTQDSTQNTAVVSGWITIPVSTKKSFTVSYLLEKSAVEDFPIIDSPGNTYEYTINIVKQPGLDHDPVTFKITFPDTWTPVDVTDFRRELNALIHLDQLEQDTSITVTWQL